MQLAFLQQVILLTGILGKIFANLIYRINKNRLLSINLFKTIEHLHSLGFTHGDLKPDNVLVTTDDDSAQLHILDILDFSPNGKSQFNTEYSPEFDYPTEKQRDNFAVMKMACELLGVEWNRSSESFAEEIGRAHV